MTEPDQAALRMLPSVDSLQDDPELTEQTPGVPPKVLVQGIRQAVHEMRDRLAAGEGIIAGRVAVRAWIVARATVLARDMMTPHYRMVINATGIVLHTALGRAVLSTRVIDQIYHELSGYSLLQADIASGERSKRDGRIESLLQQLTGAEAATVVNNNAAGTAITLNTLARGREVIVSRGQLIEIGGSFRLPEMMEAAGVRLVEVGTTNKTHPRDYERAIGENTAAIMRLHPSNYRIIGFTSEVPLSELVRIAHERNLPLIDDVGAGALVDFARFGFEPEPTLPESVAAGADIVLSSADKLIGGPQGGLILGKSQYVDAIRKNPWARIVRVDKLTLAALEATLTAFLDEELACREVPVLRMLLQSPAEIADRAERIAEGIRHRLPDVSMSVIKGFSQMGSGSLPEQNLPTRLVAIETKKPSPDECARRLRSDSPPIFARIQKDRVLFDPRTLQADEEPILVEGIVKALTSEA